MVNRAAISGFHNYNEAQNFVFGSWKEKLARVYSSHGFVTLFPRPAEDAEILKQTGGLGHEVYQIARMTDGQLTDLALPYDRTVPLAIWINQHANEVVFPFKRQQIDYSWRAERAQAARFRAFYQADVDIVGPNLGPLADVECITTLYEGLKTLGFQDFTMSLNHILISKEMIKSTLPVVDETQIKSVLRLIDKLDKQSPEEVSKQIIDINSSFREDDVRALVNQFNYQGPLSEFALSEKYGPSATAAYQQMVDIFLNLQSFGVQKDQLQFCPGMVRGLDYYTGVVFETHINGEGKAYGSIASGGRFDNLVSGLGVTRSLPGVGGSIGLTRLFDIYQRTLGIETQSEVMKKRSDADCLVIFHTDSEKNKAIEIARRLRAEGKKVDMYTQGTGVKLGNKLDYANGKGIPFSIMVFSDDISIKNMEDSTQRKYTSLDEAIDCFLGKQESFFEDRFKALSV